jgi:hypothetical protein
MLKVSVGHESPVILPISILVAILDFLLMLILYMCCNSADDTTQTTRPLKM